MAKKNPSVLWTVDQSGETGIGETGRLNAQQNIGIKGDFVKAAATNQFVTHVARKTDKTLEIHTAQPSLSNLSGLGDSKKNQSIVTNNNGAITSKKLEATEDDQTSSATTIKVVSSMTEDGQGNVTFTTKNITTATLNDPGITTLLTNTYASNTRVTTENKAVTAQGVWTAINSLFSSGLTDPSGAPGYAGLTYQNSSSKDIWFSTGTTDVKDWNLISNRVHQLIIQIKHLTINGVPGNNRNILCDKHRYTNQSGNYIFEPVTPTQLYEWVNRGDYITIGKEVAPDPWGDCYPLYITEIQSDITTLETTNIAVVGKGYNHYTWLSYWSNIIQDDDGVRYMEFLDWDNGGTFINHNTLTIKRNNTVLDTFEANNASDKTINIIVPTKTSDLSNDSGFVDKKSGMCYAVWEKTWLSTPSDADNPLKNFQDITSFSDFTSTGTSDNDVYILSGNGGGTKTNIMLAKPSNMSVKWTYSLEVKWINSSSLWGQNAGTRLLLSDSAHSGYDYMNPDYSEGAYDLEWACTVTGFGGSGGDVNPYRKILPSYYAFVANQNTCTGTLRWSLYLNWVQV